MTICRIGGVDPVMADAPLKTGRGLLTQDPQQLDLLDQVLNVLMHMGEAADGPAGQVGDGCGQVFSLSWARA